MNTVDTHLSVDLETLGWGMDAIVGSIALVPFNLIDDKNTSFDELVNRGLYLKLDTLEQKRIYKRKADKETVDFWNNQPINTQKLSVLQQKDDLPMIDALELINKFVKNSGYKYGRSLCFERGMGFDSTKLEHMYRSANITCGLHYRGFRDYRTLNDIIAHHEGCVDGKWELPEGNPENYIEHHSLHDAALDAYKLIRLFN